MNFFRNFSIGKKILTILLIVVAAEVVVALCGLYFLKGMETNLDLIVDRDSESIRLAGRMQAQTLEVVRGEKNIILAKSDGERKEFEKAIEDLQAELMKTAGRLRELSDPDEKSTLDEFARVWGRFLETTREVQRFAGLDRKDEAAALSMGKGRELRQKAGELIALIVGKNDKDLAESKARGDREVQRAITLMIILTLGALVGALALGMMLSHSISSGLNNMVGVADAIAKGNLDTPVAAKGEDETGKLAASIREMQTALRKSRDEMEAQDWLKTGIARLSEVMRGEQDMNELTGKIISEVSTYLGAQVGAIYVTAEEGPAETFLLTGSYAYTQRKNLSNRFRSGEGLVGQAALEKKPILVRNVPEDYIRVTSGLGEAVPRFISVTPLLYEERVKGVLEIGTLDDMTDLQLLYLNQVMPAAAISIETAQARDRLSEALSRSQALTEELETQQEELKAANEELEEQTQALQASEERLKTQQEELEVTNEELEEKTEALERQKRDVEQTNRNLQRARAQVEERAEQLAIAGRYKSEFLANMSHELRTPLNSLLLLARMLADNKEGTLTEEQMESAKVIHDSGNQLLSLINEILDLSRIEAGKVEVQFEKVKMDILAGNIRDHFAHMAGEKDIGLEVEMGETLPAEINTDGKRAEQIIRNLMANAIKFTDKGGRITVRMDRPQKGVTLFSSGLSVSNTVAISIKDTGIGIPEEKQKIIFEAFQQADGTTARKYGGTGLGLSISRELAHLLGGEIQMQSEVGKGSTFTLYLPMDMEKPKPESGTLKPEKKTPQPESRRDWSVEGVQQSPVPRILRSASTGIRHIASIPDDRENIVKGERVILVIEDDHRFAALLLKQCHDRGFKCLASATGEEGLSLASEHLPQAVILDIRLPGMDGWAVLEALKEDSALRHIPVHVMSVEDPTIEAFRKGAIGFLNKPVKQEDLEAAFSRLEDILDRKMKNLLVVEDDDILRGSVVRLVGNGDIRVDEAATGESALNALRTTRYDCVILDLGLPDMTGFDLLKTLERDGHTAIPPVIVYTGRDLTREEEMKLREYAESIIIKGVKSDERLLDETSLFLHRMVDKMPEKQRKMIINLHDTDLLLKDKKILMVDDDMRNIFALTKILEEKGMKVVKADDGKMALSALEKDPHVDLVLMDIMMPVMDGYETMRRIRRQARFHRLPIIALTAKAMAGDRDLCIEAGANDYLAKPVDVKRLLSMLRVWLYR